MVRKIFNQAVKTLQWFRDIDLLLNIFVDSGVKHFQNYLFEEVNQANISLDVF